MERPSIDPLKITFRPATRGDAELLLAWRNDPVTRQSSIQQAEVSREEHERWLERSLASPARQLFIAVYEERPMGTVRFDRTEEAAPAATEMSWSVAPEARGRGFGKWMVEAATRLQAGALVAKIRRENVASRKIAEFAGFQYAADEEGITWWRLQR